jgi:hypothetical protein
VDEVAPLVGLAPEEAESAEDREEQLLRAFRSPSRAAVTAVPIVMLEVIRMKVISAMNGMLKTFPVAGHVSCPAMRK